MAAKMERTRWPGIYTRGKRYVVAYRDVDGNQRRDSFRTMDEARQFQGRMRQDGGNRAFTRQRFAE